MSDVLLLLLALASAGKAPSASAALPSADQILDRYVLALGGREILEKEEAVKIQGTLEITGVQAEGPFTAMFAPPDRFTMRAEIEGLGVLEQGLSAGVGWDLDDLQGAVLLDGKALLVRELRSDAFAPLRYREHYAAIEVLERTTFEERLCYAVRCSTSWGYEELQYFDVETGFLLGSVFDEPAPGGGSLRMTNIFDGYRRFGDRWYATVTTSRTVAGDQVMMILTVDSGPVGEEAFALPPEIRALLKK